MSNTPDFDVPLECNGEAFGVYLRSKKDTFDVEYISGNRIMCMDPKTKKTFEVKFEDILASTCPYHWNIIKKDILKK